jgi:integrase
MAYTVLLASAKKKVACLPRGRVRAGRLGEAAVHRVAALQVRGVVGIAGRLRRPRAAGDRVHSDRAVDGDRRRVRRGGDDSDRRRPVRAARAGWAPSTLEGYERIVRRHIERSTDPKQKPLAGFKLRELSIDRVVAWSQANERALAPTAVIALIALNQIGRFAVRRGWLASNPVAKLEPAERPHWTPQTVSILEGEQLARLLDHAGNYRPLFELLAYTGLRIGEALGLTWADVDFDADLIRVHRQLSRRREHRPLKTEAGRREVILAPAVAKLLRQRWLASRYKAPTNFVFCNTLGRGLDYRDVGEGFRAAVKRAGITAPGRLSPHSLRHAFASLLISRGLNVVFVSRQLGHANPNITLGTYAHLFERANHDAAARDALESSYEAMLGSGRATS